MAPQWYSWYVTAKMTSHLEMSAGHLNAPYGRVLPTADLALALRSGSLRSIGSGLSRALLMSLFVECPPQPILLAAVQVGGAWVTLRSLYQQAVANGMQRVKAWESAA